MVTHYACVIKRADVPSHSAGGGWQWAGLSAATSHQIAAVNLAVSVKGYDESQFESHEEIIEKFVDDGWRFKMYPIKDTEDGLIEIRNDEVY